MSTIGIVVRKGCGVWTGNDRAACFDLLRAILGIIIIEGVEFASDIGKVE